MRLTPPDQCSNCGSTDLRPAVVSDATVNADATAECSNCGEEHELTPEEVTGNYKSPVKGKRDDDAE